MICRVPVQRGSRAMSEAHSHVFLGAGHDAAERRTMAVIWLCGAMMALEIGGGLLFGSIALVADGLHMSTHAGALLLAALAYRYAPPACDEPGVHLRHRQVRRPGRLRLGDRAGDDRGAHRLREPAAAVRAGADPFRRGDPDRLPGPRGQRRLRLAARRRARPRPRPPPPRARPRAWARACARQRAPGQQHAGGRRPCPGGRRGLGTRDRRTAAGRASSAGSGWTRLRAWSVRW